LNEAALELARLAGNAQGITGICSRLIIYAFAWSVA
jgi:hypothetical protein